jgi:hypothetical protein
MDSLVRLASYGDTALLSCASVSCCCEKLTFASEAPRSTGEDGRFWRLADAD